MNLLKTKNLFAKKLRPLALAVAAALTLATAVPTALEAAPDKYPYTAVTTVGMITDIVRNVAGDKAEVEGLIGEGVDPHLYKPTRGDVMALSRADIIFYSGLMLEGKMADVLIRVARKGKPVYAVTEEILDQGDYVMTDEQEHYDPHVWMDVGGWIMATDVVGDALGEYDPANVAYYRQNADAYMEKLRKLDAYVREVIATIPENQRVLVTAHDAFNYMGRAYDLEVMGIQGISTESEAGVKDIENLVNFLVENHIPAVFVETSVSDKNVRALVEGARARGHDLKIGGSLFSDAMGAPGTYEGTYIGMLDHNATTIAKALGGNPPAKGLNGKLSNGQ
ncbi:zinc ABC transporter substrate-binding protein [Ruficoccus amylovorans]|uniref:Zinc ABC transporter substrate-binding protein n=1 Tax=Ruficoccus amylovorans TaxID=1804625 RepID=A0A842HCG2_9BACT|nr:zinc ABC transporter substrate-binding protein [Ruficoccus amylovorans]MBC2593234.1 zinc ABC transporter substrate-binding protein [Ruficoccus amylovorans]